MSSFQFSPDARKDLGEIFDNLAQYSTQAAEKFLESVDQKCRFLAQHSDVGARKEMLMAGLRAFGVGKYVIFFRKIDDSVEIVRILHGARDLPSFFADDTEGDLPE